MIAKNISKYQNKGIKYGDYKGPNTGNELVRYNEQKYCEWYEREQFEWPTWLENAEAENLLLEELNKNFDTSEYKVSKIVGYKNNSVLVVINKMYGVTSKYFVKVRKVEHEGYGVIISEFLTAGKDMIEECSNGHKYRIPKKIIIKDNASQTETSVSIKYDYIIAEELLSGEKVKKIDYTTYRCKNNGNKRTVIVKARYTNNGYDIEEIVPADGKLLDRELFENGKWCDQIYELARPKEKVKRTVRDEESWNKRLLLIDTITSTVHDTFSTSIKNMLVLNNSNNEIESVKHLSKIKKK